MVGKLNVEMVLVGYGRLTMVRCLLFEASGS